MTPRGHPPGAAGGVVMKGYMNERSKSQKANDRRRKYIKQLKDEAGGKCELSGDETKGMGWNKLKKEADKCILMCNRCHTEFHSGMITIDGQYSKEALDNMARYFSDTV